MKLSLIHPLLFGFYPILFLFSNNISMLEINDLIIPVLFILSVICIVWAIIGKISKNYVKTSLIISSFLFLFFSYGRIYDSLQDYLITTTIPEIGHSLLLFFMIPIFVIVSIYVIKSKRKFNNLTKILNYLSVVLVLMASVTAISFIFENQLSVEQNSISNNIVINSSTFNPDIYLIILDEYGNSKYLDKYYNFDNVIFTNELKKKGFHFPENPTVNYPTSTFSITSLMTMNYLTDDMLSKTGKQNQQNFFRAVDNNESMKFLKTHNYKIYNFESGTELTRHIQLADYHLCGTDLAINSELTIKLLDSTMLKPIYTQLFVKYDREQILCVFSNLENIPHILDEPSFIFAHIIKPHPPYIFGPDGNSRSFPETLDLRGDRDAGKNVDGYIGQLQFVNKNVLSIVDEILKNDQRQSVIILISDHGSRFLLDPRQYQNDYAENGINIEAYKERMSNLFAIYLPEENSTIFPDDITLVNLFRIIFNSYFNGNYEILENKNYFITHTDPINFIDITKYIKTN